MLAQTLVFETLEHAAAYRRFVAQARALLPISQPDHPLSAGPVKTKTLTSIARMLPQ